MATIKRYTDISQEKCIAWLETQGEQKPTDKIKLKFKVGDWVVYDHKVYQIIELPKEGYINLCLIGNGKIEFAPSTYCKHWTIQDAKDGDVFCYKDEISLYKHDIKNCTKQGTTFGGFVYHCCYDGKRFIINSLYSLTEQDKIDIHPATKEQRDLLFQKMKEACYEWDAKKKELNKIEQNHAWSEEDEVLLKLSVENLTELKDRYGEKYGRVGGCIDWLESKLESLRPQNMWKPSDEQIETLENVRKILHVNKEIYSKANNLMYNFEELIRTLKKLKG